MAAYHGSPNHSAVKGIANHGMGTTQSAPRPSAPAWEQTPWSNWHRWFGLDLRRAHLRGYRNGITWWEYGNSKKVARNVLSSTYGDPDMTQDAGVATQQTGRARR